MNQIFDFFLDPYRTATTFNIIIEIIAVIFGIASVWFAQKENILVFPTGIINTVIFVYICYIFTPSPFHTKLPINKLPPIWNLVISQLSRSILKKSPS